MYFSFTRFSPPQAHASNSSASASSSATSSPTNSITSIYSLPPFFLNDSHHTTALATTSTCAYPSWPRRTSLTTSPLLGATTDLDEQPATSYISDDDLFPDVFSDSDEDYSPAASPRIRPVNLMTPARVQTPIGSVHASVPRDLYALGGGGANVAATMVDGEDQATLVPKPTLAERMAMKKMKASSSSSSSLMVSVFGGEGQQRRRRRRSSRKSSAPGEKLSPILEGGE